MDEERREILNQVAQGTLSPEEAAARLDELARAGSAGSAAGAAPGPGQIKRVVVQTNFGAAEVVGDPRVVEAEAQGPHVARRQGDTIVIESEDVDDGLTGFYFSRGRGTGAVLGFGQRPPLLRVRMNPQLALELSCAAGRVQVRDVRGPIHAEVSAGTVSIDGFVAPIDVSTTAGRLTASGVLDHGVSRIRCDAGKVAVHLQQGSNVRVRSRATLGRVTLMGREANTSLIDGGVREVTLGSGEATLDVETSVGKIRITADDAARETATA